MAVQIIIRNVVIVGNYTPGFFDKYFFIKNNIFEEIEIKDFVLMPIGNGIQMVTSKFIIVADINQIIITSLKPDESDNIDFITAKIISCINVDAAVRGLGLNFHLLTFDLSESLQVITRKYFYSESNQLFKDEFDSTDSMYGVYASKNFKEGRLKLDVKPTISQESANPFAKKDGILFSFNFHFELQGKNRDEIVAILNDYSTYKRESEKIVSKY